MKREIRNEKGITLVELLAVIVIGGIVMVLIMSIFTNGQRQYNSQTTKAEQLNDVRYAAKVITKEIRKADKVELNSTILKLGTDSPVIFTFADEKIIQNGATLVSDIEEFSILKVGRSLEINIISNEQNGKRQEVKTEIFIREGVIVE